MKKLIMMAAVMILGISTFAQNNNEEAQAIAAARKAVSQQCGPTGNTTVQVVENFVCNNPALGVGNLNRTITFYRPDPCPNPTQPCIQVIVVVGSATVDCDGTVTNVTCGPPVVQL